MAEISNELFINKNCTLYLLKMSQKQSIFGKAKLQEGGSGVYDSALKKAFFGLLLVNLFQGVKYIFIQPFCHQRIPSQHIFTITVVKSSSITSITQFFNQVSPRARTALKSN